jgi:hypothetical protein
LKGHLKQARNLLKTDAAEFHIDAFFDCMLAEDDYKVGLENTT